MKDRFNAWLCHRSALAYARGEHHAWFGGEFHADARTERARLEREFAACYP